MTVELYRHQKSKNIDISLHGVDKNLPSKWKKASKFIEPAIKRTGGTYDLESVTKMVLDVRYHLWLIFEEKKVKKRKSKKLICAFLTEFVIYPSGKRVCAMPFLGGKDMLKYVWMYDIVKGFAKANQCEEVELFLRKGWQRVFKQFECFNNSKEYYISVRSKVL